MNEGLRAAFERFLVEDVILNLGNLRMTLGWLADSDSRMPATALQAGLERLQGQIDGLEDRARQACRDLSFGAAPLAATSGATTDASGMTLDALLRDALGADGAPLPAPLFRTRRAMAG